MVKNIILCGIGGQGILLGAKIIATAAELASFSVTTHEIHGMAQRGGSVTAQLRYGESVSSPLILEGTADVLASLEAAESLRYAHYLAPDALCVVSRQLIIPVTVSTGAAKYPEDLDSRLARVFKNLKYIDLAAIACRLGDRRLANTVMLGALSNALPEIDSGIWAEAIFKCVKKEFAGSNLKAFEEGKEA